MLNHGQRRNRQFIPHPLIHSSFVYRPHSHRHRHRPGHGVRRGTAPGGATKTHVFAGHVQVTAMGGRNGGSTGLLLRAGQDAICDGNSPTVRVVASSVGAAGQFVRTLASPSPSIAADAYADFVLSLRPVVYYRMEPPKDEKDRNVIFDSAPGHHHGVLHFSPGFVGSVCFRPFRPRTALPRTDGGRLCDRARLPQGHERSVDRFGLGPGARADERWPADRQ